jgi:glucose/arabinose dehydrogenase/cytochrome c551/c552
LVATTVTLSSILLSCILPPVSVGAEANAMGDENLEVAILAQGIEDGMEMTIANDGRIFAIERKGKVKLIDPAKPGEVTTIVDLESDTRCESGLIGICLDPKFDDNGWIYMYHTVPIDDDPEYHMHHLGRFDYKNGKIDPASEKVLLKVKASYKKRIHEAGSIAFDSKGLLYLSCGDNQIRSEYLFSCKTSANSNDLRGKILRIRPTPEGGYTIPEGNLFKPGTPKTRPEIYIMGLRNPFRIHIDPKTDWLLWGENGPPNNWVPGTKIDKNTAPDGYDEYNLAKGPSFRGYPMVIADQQAFPNYDFDAEKTRPKFDPKKPVNDHKDNTGVKELPPSQPPLIWYQNEQKEFPELGKGGESAIAGPVYRMSDKYPKDLRLPAVYDSSWFIGEYARGWVKAAELDDDGNLVKIRHVLPRVRLGKPTNLKMGPKGRLHVLYYGPNGGVVRLVNKGQGGVPYTTLKSHDKPPKSISKKDKGLALMAKSDCLNCHQWQTVSVAPKYVDIAKRYKDTPNAAALLTQKVLKGGGGVWGEIPMPPHPQHTEQDAAEMVATILKINALDQPKKKKTK